MLTISEISQFIQEDATSEKKRAARIGQNYYEGKHDILNYRLFYYDADGNIQEDETRSNVKIAHPFFTELVDQQVQYMLSGEGYIFKSDLPELQNELDAYFNENEDFSAELYELLTDSIVKGFAYMYAYKNEDDKTAFQCADSLGVVEVRACDTDDNTEHVIYWYIDRIEKGHKKIKRIQVWDGAQTYYYVQDGEGNITEDEDAPLNPRPHTLYKMTGEMVTYFEDYGQIPFFRLDNGKKQTSGLKSIKSLIDDYDLHACALSNNLVDFDTPLHVVKGFQGDNLDELQTNLKTKKIIGIPEGDGGVEVQTVNIPYQARETKLEIDESNIYRFGMGLSLANLKDTSATTNIAIKAAYTLLDLKCNKLEIRLKQFLRKILKIVLKEINDANGTDFQQKDVYFEFTREAMVNEEENTRMALTRAQTEQVRINTMLNLAGSLDDETIIQTICEILDIDYEELKDKLPTDEEKETAAAAAALEAAGGMTDEQQATGNPEITG